MLQRMEPATISIGNDSISLILVTNTTKEVLYLLDKLGINLSC